MKKARKSPMGNKILATWVPLDVYALAQKQARIEGKNMSQMIGKLLVAHLKKEDTTISL